MLKYRLQLTTPKRIIKINGVRIMFGCKCNYIQASFTNTKKYYGITKYHL